jgi:putative transposase
VNLIHSCLKRLVGMSVNVLRTRCVHWTTPFTSSLTLGTLADLARSKAELMAENALLRQRLIILKRQMKRPACTKTDRVLLVLLARVVRTWNQALFIVQPDTRLALYWKRRSKASSHLPKVAAETIALIREMAKENRLWGAERIRGEVLKLGMRVCKRTIQKYMRQVRTPQPRGQKWATFVHNHAAQIWACDFLQVTDLFFRPLAGLLHHRTQVTEGEPRRRDTISDRSLGRATPTRSHAIWASTEVSDLRS